MLDPTLVVAIIKALKTNQSLQELVLTDGVLNACDQAHVFGNFFFKCIANNRKSQLCMVDISRNSKTVDDVPEAHKDILEGINLLSAAQQQEGSKLERFILTTKTDGEEWPIVDRYSEAEAHFDIIVNGKVVNQKTIPANRDVEG